MEVNPPNNVRVSLKPGPGDAVDLPEPGICGQRPFRRKHAEDVELISYDRRGVTPIAQQWNLDIQRELHGGILIEAGYYGNKLDHMWRKIDGNPAPPGSGNRGTCAASSFRLPCPAPGLRSRSPT